MSEPFVGEIRVFGGNFAPRGWAFCDGQLLAVSQNDALFSLLGTIYGGDGRTTFGLPDLRGRVPVHAGSGPGLSPRRLGDRGGTEAVTLTAAQIPSHGHALPANSRGATDSPAGGVIAGHPADPSFTDAPADVDMASSMVQAVGGSSSHTNLQPALCLHFIIALFGIYPSRT